MKGVLTPHCFGTCCSKLLSLAERFQVLERPRGRGQVEALMLNKQYRSSVCSLPSNFFQSQTQKNRGGCKKKRNDFPEQGVKMMERFLFLTERVGTTCSQQQPRLTVSIGMHTEAKLECVCYALTEKPSWACQLSSPYMLRRLIDGKMREHRHNTDTKA